MKALHYFSILLLSLVAMSSLAEKLSGYDIMKLADERDDGDRSVMDMEMILVDKNGNQRERYLHSYSRDMEGRDTQSIMFFTAPPDVKNTGFLSYDYDDERDDDQWLYLPALKKTKRIASSNKDSKFMGSDFTYADMSRRKLENYDYKLLKEDEVDGHKVWIVEAVPNTEKEQKETGYTKSVLFVRQDIHVIIRSISWVKKGGFLKYMEIKKLSQIDGIWTPEEIVMTTKKNNQTVHSTVMYSKNVRYNQAMDDELFTTRRLEKGL